MFELDRKCRRRALASARALPADAKLFVNVFPSADVRPRVPGREPHRDCWARWASGPDRIVLEITEKYAIENYRRLRRGARRASRGIGFEIAVDDVGAGYSGLEKIAHLNPRYLKLDRELVRDIDSSYIRREMTRALKAFADKIGSTDHRRRHRARGRAGGAAWSSASSTARASCSAGPPTAFQAPDPGPSGRERDAKARRLSCSPIRLRAGVPLPQPPRGFQPLPELALGPARRRSVVAPARAARRAGTPWPTRPPSSSWA